MEMFFAQFLSPIVIGCRILRNSHENTIHTDIDRTIKLVIFDVVLKINCFFPFHFSRFACYLIISRTSFVE